MVAGLAAYAGLGNSVYRRADGQIASTDSFPHLRTMDGNLFIDLEAQFHLAANNLEHRHRAPSL